MSFDSLNPRDQLARIVEWLDFQDADLSQGLKTPEDAIKLSRYMRKKEHLSELADEWDAADRIKAIGYDPFQNV